VVAAGLQSMGYAPSRLGGDLLGQCAAPFEQVKHLAVSDPLTGLATLSPEWMEIGKRNRTKHNRRNVLFLFYFWNWPASRKQ